MFLPEPLLTGACAVLAGKLDEDVVRTTAEALVKSGLAAKGYRYGTLAAALRTLNP